jgi:hypothetical protein
MAKHDFVIGITEHGNTPVGARCSRCGEIVLYVNGSIPREKQNEECPYLDVNQTAARIVKKATEE